MFSAETAACRPTDPEVKASLYAHPGKGLLILAANFNPDRRQVAIALDLAAFGLADRTLGARNALTNQVIGLSRDGVLRPTIAGKSFVLVQID